MKQLLINILRKSGEALLLNKLIEYSEAKLFAPFYHTVSNEELPHIRHLYAVRSVKKFERDLDFLLNYYKPVGLTELLNLVGKGELQTEKRVFLSFDDGLRECIEVIAPILSRKGVEAAFFLNPNFLDNNDLMFRYKASLLQEALKKASAAQKQKVTEQLSSIKKKDLLHVNYAERNVLDAIAQTLEVDFNEFLKEQQPYMTTDEVKKLQQMGFEAGAHSLDHPLFSELSHEEQLWQATKSLEEVRRRFQSRTNAFAFPFTDDGVSKRMIEELHQKFNALTFGTAGLKKDFSDMHLQRFPMEGTGDKAEQLVKGEYLYYILRKIVGKHIVNRL